MKRWKVLVTAPEYAKGEEVFAAAGDLELAAAPPGEAELAAAVRASGARAVIVGVERYEGLLYTALPRGGVIARFGVGYDGIRTDRAAAAGVLATNTPGVLEDAVAEHTIALMLAATRNLPAHVRAMDRGEWAPRQGIELRGRTLAVIGCGAIGRRVARVAALGFGMQVIGMEPRKDLWETLRRDWSIARLTEDLAEALGAADVVSLHVPANPATRGLIDARAIARMRPGAILVNTARGMVVDEGALYDALAAGRLSAAGLDVFETEPYAPRAAGRDLRTLPNVVLTPHVSSSTREACARVAAACLENVRHARDRRYGAMSLLNPEVCARLGTEPAGAETGEGR